MTLPPAEHTTAMPGAIPPPGCPAHVATGPGGATRLYGGVGVERVGRPAAHGADPPDPGRDDPQRRHARAYPVRQTVVRVERAPTRGQGGHVERGVGRAEDGTDDWTEEWTEEWIAARFAVETAARIAVRIGQRLEHRRPPAARCIPCFAE
ncbi:hypothetical protein ACWCQ0_53545 [Streptomyces massasporeus]